jgi:hypothetical protein
VNPATQATAKINLTVALLPVASPGQVFNGAGASAFGGDLFLFVNEAGGIAGWRNALGTTAELLRSPSTPTSTRAPRSRRSAATATCTRPTSGPARSTS